MARKLENIIFTFQNYFPQFCSTSKNQLSCPFWKLEISVMLACMYDSFILDEKNKNKTKTKQNQVEKNNSKRTKLIIKNLIKTNRL